MPREILLQQLAKRITDICIEHPIRVAIDGPDAAGKTTLADELAEIIKRGERTVIRASIDAFHYPRSTRYQQGELSPAGYFQDSFDLEAVITHLLVPLGNAGSRYYRTGIFDYRTDSPVTLPEEIAPDDAILLFDGVFLMRPPLLAHWDLSIYVHIAPWQSLERALMRERKMRGGQEVFRDRYLRRYIPAQEMYITQYRPQNVANLVVDNTNLADPFLVTFS